MRFSLDFDGVLTDHRSLDLDVLDHQAFFLSPTSASYAPCRKGVRQLAALLSCFGDLEILTARPVSHRRQILAWIKKHAPELGASPINSSGSSTKPYAVAAGQIALHIDDDPIAGWSADSTDTRVIVWKNESPSALLEKVVSYLRENLLQDLSFRGEQVLDIRLIPVTSSTPVATVRTTEGNYKVRLFDSDERRIAVTTFYSIVEGTPASKWLPRELGTSGLAMVTQFIDGEMVKEKDIDTELSLLADMAHFLAIIHRQNIDSSPDRLISCAVDRFNICITPQGEPYVIDVGDCMSGSRWIDIIWSEQLLCATDEQRKSFVDLYMGQTQERPSQEEVRRALAGYYSHLHWTLMTSKAHNAQDVGRLLAIQKIVEKHRIPPTTSFLYDYTTERS